MRTGEIKFFNDERGFGFIRPDDDGADVFFHFSAFRDHTQIKRGRRVNFDVAANPRDGRTLAAFVVPIEDRANAVSN
jgi:CspA family cold shock protein